LPLIFSSRSTELLCTRKRGYDLCFLSIPAFFRKGELGDKAALVRHPDCRDSKLLPPDLGFGQFRKARRFGGSQCLLAAAVVSYHYLETERSGEAHVFGQCTSRLVHYTERRSDAPSRSGDNATGKQGAHSDTKGTTSGGFRRGMRGLILKRHD
jgi:hypothetical protein